MVCAIWCCHQCVPPRTFHSIPQVILAKITTPRRRPPAPVCPPAGIHEMAPPLCGAAVISHNEVSETDHQRTARRTSPMKQALSTGAIDLAKKIVHRVGADSTGKTLWRKRLTHNAL